MDETGGNKQSSDQLSDQFSDQFGGYFGGQFSGWFMGRFVGRMYGRGLRFVLVGLLQQHGQLTVAEMVAAIEQSGFPVEGRLSKVISDALRWELARGRVTRPQRGVYQYRGAPPATARRIKRFAEQCHTWIVAITRHDNPPPTPPDTRQTNRPLDDPNRAPWHNTAWLWTT